MTNHELYMHRCLELAKYGAGYVAPNPMVGAILVNEGRVIGEGFHKQYGNSHAEVNCIANVAEADRNLIPKATLYVSLEPCDHHGKTPPCTDSILAYKIPKVVVGCIDSSIKVNGKGIEKLKNAGVDVSTGILGKECEELNKRFFTNHSQQRPYIILKWAQSANQKIGNTDGSRILISNEFTNRMVHKWRSEEAAIMVGTNTALADNPSLDVRLWSGPNPVRLVLDLNLRLPSSLNIFNNQQPTIIFNKKENSGNDNLKYVKIEGNAGIVEQVLNACYQQNIQSILIEGGAKLLQTFIDEKAWDEARVIQNNEIIIANGLPAPELFNQQLLYTEKVETDNIFHYKNLSNRFY